MKLLLIILFSIMLTIPFALSATIHGTTYSDQLSILKNVKLEINTEPKQTFISKDGQYSFNVPPGNYLLTAEYSEPAIKYSAKENVNVSKDGDYVIDLILFEDIDEYDELEETELNIDEKIEFEQKDNYLYYILSALVIFALATIIYVYKKRKLRRKDGDTETELVLKEIKKASGRITQKELRKKFHYSEAKISLILTELEHQNKITKIKKGRGNIIILKK